MSVHKDFSTLKKHDLTLAPQKHEIDRERKRIEKILERQRIKLAEIEREEAEEKRILEEAIKRIKENKKFRNRVYASQLEYNISGLASLDQKIAEQEYIAQEKRAERNRIEYERKMTERRLESDRLLQMQEAKRQRQEALERAERKLREIEEISKLSDLTIYTPSPKRKIKFD